MLCRNVNRFLQAIVLWFFCAAAFAGQIDKTTIAYYDLANNRSEHYDVNSILNDGQTDFIFMPTGDLAGKLTTFRTTACITSSSAAIKKGIVTIAASKMGSNETRLANMGNFVNEHNLRGAWIHLNARQDLFFSPETEGMMVVAPPSHMNRCQRP
ncbi:TPA: hypothetical protein ACIPUI_001123 [Citrobacter freundii]